MLFALWRNDRLRNTAAELQSGGVTLTWSKSPIAWIWPTAEKATFNYTVRDDGVQIGSKLYTLNTADDEINVLVAANCDRVRELGLEELACNRQGNNPDRYSLNTKRGNSSHKQVQSWQPPNFLVR
jgi:hypothetical protein